MITKPEIKKALEEYDITADRKSLYDDIATLEKLGIKVEGEKEGKGYYYHVAGKHFEIAELKLLVDSIQSSKFITAKKSNELIKKLTAMASKYEASQLHRLYLEDPQMAEKNGRFLMEEHMVNLVILRVKINGIAKQVVL